MILLSLFVFTGFSEIIQYTNVKRFIIQECRKYPSKKINEKVIHAIMYWESRLMRTNIELYDTRAKSFDKCLGLMQIKKCTLDTYNWRREKYLKKLSIPYNYLKMKHLYIPEINLKVGIWCFAFWLTRTKGDIYKALTLYSGGAKGYERKVMNKIISLYIYER